MLPRGALELAVAHLEGKMDVYDNDVALFRELVRGACAAFAAGMAALRPWTDLDERAYDHGERHHPCAEELRRVFAANVRAGVDEAHRMAARMAASGVSSRMLPTADCVDVVGYLRGMAAAKALGEAAQEQARGLVYRASRGWSFDGHELAPGVPLGPVARALAATSYDGVLTDLARAMPARLWFYDADDDVELEEADGDAGCSAPEAA